MRSLQHLFFLVLLSSFLGVGWGWGWEEGRAGKKMKLILSSCSCSCSAFPSYISEVHHFWVRFLRM